MTLDSLAGDAAWLGRYALNAAGEVLPWAVIEDKLRATFPFDVFMCGFFCSLGGLAAVARKPSSRPPPPARPPPAGCAPC